MSMFYSPSANAFVFHDSPLSQTSDFSDAVPVSDEVFTEFAQAEKNGQRRVSGVDGMPEWEDIPAPTAAELHEREVISALQNKAALLAAANATIEPLGESVELDIATDEEVALYHTWRKYRVLLNRVNTSVIPVSWPPHLRLNNNQLVRHLK